MGMLISGTTFNEFGFSRSSFSMKSSFVKDGGYKVPPRIDATEIAFLPSEFFRATARWSMRV